MDLNSILTIVGIVLLLGVAGGSIFGALKVRELIGKFDTKLDPKLDDIGSKLKALLPAFAEGENIMKSVNLTMDSLNVTLMDVDGKLVKLTGIIDMVFGVCKAIPIVAKDAKNSAKSHLLPKR